MFCMRCGGLMVVEPFCDLMEEESRMGIDTTRCLNCGNFEDAIIRANRITPRLPSRVRSHAGRARGPRPVQAGWLQKAMQTEGVFAEYPHDQALCSSGGASSTPQIVLESAHIEQCDPFGQSQRRQS